MLGRICGPGSPFRAIHFSRNFGHQAAVTAGLEGSSGDAIILSYHRACLPLADEVGAIITEVLERHGIPTASVTWVRERTSRQRTARFMAHPDVSLVLASCSSISHTARTGARRPSD